MNYYKRHIGDYAAATRHLGMLEHGAYAMLLDVYYMAEGPLPADVKSAARKAGARSRDEVAAVELVLREFFVLQDDGWHQPRCDAELAAMRDRASSNAAVGRKGGRPRKTGGSEPPVSETQSVSEKNPMGFAAETQSVSENANAPPQVETLAISHKPIANSQYMNSSSSSDGGGGAGAGLSGDDDGRSPVSESEWAERFSAEAWHAVSGYDVHDRTKFWPLAREWVDAGVSVGEMRAAVRRARSEATEPIAYLPGYVARVLRSMREAAQRQGVAPGAAVADGDVPAEGVRRESFREAAARQARDHFASLAGTAAGEAFPAIAGDLAATGGA